MLYRPIAFVFLFTYNKNFFKKKKKIDSNLFADDTSVFLE